MSHDEGPGGAERLGRYTLVRRIGKGGMGEVWLGKATGAHGFEKPVALKRILPQFSRNEHVVNMLVDEARICVMLSHPNVVQVLELGEDEGEYFIAMEYVEGQALSRLMRRLRKQGKRLDVLEACFIAIQLLEGLHAAHIQKDQRGKPAGIIHRDVSPQNVLISSSGQVKVIDFGIARARERLEVTQGANVKGKLRYMAPEQISPKSLKGAPLDHRVDVFAAGIVLFEMLANRQRFPGDHEIELMDAILKEDTPDLCREGLIDRTMQDILDKALEKDRSRRYADAAAFAAQLRSYLYKRDPGFTAERLGRRMREAFADSGDEKSEPRREATGAARRSLPSDTDGPLHGEDTEDKDATRTAFRPRLARGADDDDGDAPLPGSPVRAGDPTRVRKKGGRRRSRVGPLAAGLVLGAGVLGGLYWAFLPHPASGGVGGLALAPGVDAGASTTGEPPPATPTPPAPATNPTPTSVPIPVPIPAPTPSPAPSPAPVADGAGVIITVVVEPPTARISLATQPDPKYVSPAHIKLMRGEAVQVVMEAEGYETERRSLVADQSQQLTATLKPLPVDLILHVFPRDAVVSVDGEPARPGMKVRPGVPVELRAEHPFAAPKVLSATPVAGQALVVELRLDEVERGKGAHLPKGQLFIDSKPIGADIWVDGRKLSGLTPHTEPVLAGSHRVTVRLGDSEQSFNVNVLDGARVPVTAQLE